MQHQDKPEQGTALNLQMHSSLQKTKRKLGKTTASGLQYIITKEGTGKQPTAQSIVKVHYEGRLINGQVFDSSYKRGQPVEFPLNQVIPGWTEGLQLMKEGGKATFFIPSNLAYGPQELPGIPANSTLIFDVELISVK
jgi:FKBP-type peptidyl-prolyl cis-trans isomerase FkpA